MDLNYHSWRSKQARYGYKLKRLRPILILLSPLGIPFMLLMWQKHHWRRLPTKPGSIDGRLTAGILGQLKSNPTALDLARAATTASSGRFIIRRFAIPADFFTSIAPNLDLKTVLTTADQLREEAGQDVISGGLVLAALIKSAPDYEKLLAKYQLDLPDLLEGIRWQDQNYYLERQAAEPIRTGGLARDWSFGWTPLLDQFGRNISAEVAAHGGRTMSLMLPSRRKIVGRMLDIFSQGGRQNVAIVGPDGAGKTSVVHDFAEVIIDADANIPTHLKFRQIFLLDPAAIMAASPARGDLENLISRIFAEASHSKNVIICLDNAHLFFADGTGSVNLQNVLLPILEKGNLRLILTLNEQKLLEIGQNSPAVMNALNRINITASDDQETLAAIEDRAGQLERTFGVLWTFQALKAIIKLSSRYVRGRVQPGQAVSLLESSANYAQGGIVDVKEVEACVTSTLGVEVGVATDEADKEKLLNLEQLLHQRMINQTRAVQVVSDALRRARAGVRNQNRPIGTFLFLGPTGVGKTELSKALAAVYYGDEQNLVRADLNQFVTADKVADLTADPGTNPQSLTAQVMKRPFSVVLLDEIEKAHPNVLTALLQLLDEGILRDTTGEEVSFRDCIVIATSNAGALHIRDLVEQGKDLAEVQEIITDQLVSSGEFKPEFLNRFDEIVTFVPLGKAELLQVLDLIIAGVNKTLADQKVKVQVDPAAAEKMVELGYDPRLGARPMRRVVQKIVENQVAKQVLAGQVESGGTVVITPDMVQ
ncbi:AAA family ATPase [Candidatus Saccharibacteria bacterium]|nr:AAA family ATPase [Candidatus Saccharibacteria bacterium]